MILVTGATGKVGRALVDLLLADGQKVRGITRNRATAALPGGVDVVVGDPSQPKTLASSLRGVESLFLNPGTLGDAAAELLSLAVEQGVQRVVLLSAVTVEYGGGYCQVAERFKAVEDSVIASGIPWTFLRSADLDANALVWVPQIRSTCVVRGAYGDAATSPIHERDLAAVGAGALLSSAHAGHSYALTGPQSLNQRDKVRLIGEVIGKELSFEEISPEQVRETMKAQGVPPDVPDRMLGYLAECLRNPGPSTANVELLLSRPALTFAEWATDHAAAFRN